MDDFPNRLKNTRLSLGLSQKQFGTLGGVSDSAQGYYENSIPEKRREPSVSYFLNLKENGIDIYYLLTGEKVKSELDSEESLLLETFRNGDEQTQDLILDLCRTLSRLPQSANVGTTNINSDTHTKINTGGGDYMPKGKKKS